MVGRKQLQGETEFTKKDPSPVEEEEEEEEEERREVPLEEEGESQQTVKLREKAFSPTIGAAAVQVSMFGGCLLTIIHLSPCTQTSHVYRTR